MPVWVLIKIVFRHHRTLRNGGSAPAEVAIGVWGDFRTQTPANDFNDLRIGLSDFRKTVPHNDFNDLDI